MNTISAEEIEPLGISALDELLKEGPVHVTKNNWPTYFVMSEKAITPRPTTADRLGFGRFGGEG